MVACWICYVAVNKRFLQVCGRVCSCRQVHGCMCTAVLGGGRVDGMDVLAVKNATAFAKDYALKNGPIVLEMVRARFARQPALLEVAEPRCAESALSARGPARPVA